MTNAMMAHADQTDDSHAPSHSHLGCGVVPAALASGEQFGISGAHLLRAVTLGYDVGARFTMALGGERYENESQSQRIVSPLSLEPLPRPDVPPASMPGKCEFCCVHSATMLRARLLAPRQRSHPEGLRLRRHDGAQRRHVRFAPSGRLDGSGGSSFGQGQFL
jgi:hypothetical protein